MATDEEVRPFARAIWEKEGCPEGRAEEHWRRAKELLENLERQGKGGAHILSISDWISFLTTEKNPNIAIIISFSAVWLAIFSVVQSVTNNTLLSAITFALFGVALMLIYLRTIGPYGRRANRAAELLKDIMSGKESDSPKIAERWKSVGGEQKNK